jgi:drug/metabolite transporter (DMT)-like permease
MASKTTGYVVGLLLIVLADLCWGTVFVVSQVALQYTNPYNLVFLRFAIASLPILAVSIPLEKRIGTLRELKKKWTWLFGFIYSLGFLFQYVGQDLTTASEATLLTNLSPIIIPVFAVFLLKERMTTYQKLAMMMGLAGLYLVASPRLAMGLYQTMGNILLLATSFSYALFTVLNKKMNVASLGSSFSIMLSVTVILAPVAVIMGSLSPASMSIGPIGWVAILYLAIPCTMVAISIYLKGLDLVPASVVAPLFLIQVLVGLLLSALILGDFLSLPQTVGAIAILAALAFGVKVRR